VQHLPSVPAALGWNDHQAALAADLPPGLIFGRVARADRGRALVLTASGTLHPSTRDQVAVGDWVGVDPGGERVHGVLPRRSSITRRDPGQVTDELVLAANVDRVLVLHVANRPVNHRRLERELVLAWETGAVPVVVLTKIDLSPDPEGALAEAEAVAIGADVLAVRTEPGCAVRGVFGEDRLNSWRKLRRELARTSGERTAHDKAQERRRGKIIHKANRAHRPRP
jgi:ribosome biogenesis GTPase